MPPSEDLQGLVMISGVAAMCAIGFGLMIVGFPFMRPLVDPNGWVVECGQLQPP